VSVVSGWLTAWLGGSVLGVVNGVVREKTYKKHVDDLAADQISAVSLAAMLGLYFGALERRWPIPSTRTALEIGGAWTVLTIAFEFGFGHYADHKSWSELAANYDARGGNLWSLVLVWIAVGPAVVRRVTNVTVDT
jgi:hypothetical protein